jgi:hypothetical protein
MPFSLKTLLHNVSPGSFPNPDPVNIPSDTTYRVKPPEADPVPRPAPPPEEPSCFIKGVIRSVELNPEQWEIDFANSTIVNQTLDITLSCPWFMWTARVAKDSMLLSTSDGKAISSLFRARRAATAAPTIRAMEALGCPTSPSPSTDTPSPSS